MPSSNSPSEWEELVAAVTVHLRDISPAGLDDNQVVTLARATGRNSGTVVRFAEAHRLGQELDVSADSVYALLHQGLPPDAPALVAASEDVHRRAVERSIAAGAVPTTVAERTDAAVSGLKKVAIEQPVFLVHPDWLYAITAEAAVGESKTAKLVSARLDARLRDLVHRAIGTVSVELDRALYPGVARLKWQESADRSVTELVSSLLAKAGKDPALAAEAAGVRNRMAAAPRRVVRDALHLRDPLNQNPLLDGDLARGKAVEYARLAGLGAAAIRAVLERSAALADGDGSALTPLVANGSLKTEDAEALRTVLEVGKLTGDNLPLMRALAARSETAPSVLAAKTREGWQQLLQEHDVPLPPGETAASYADAMAWNLEQTFATQALAARIEDGAVTTFFQNNPDLDLRFVDFVQPNGATLSWKGISKKQKPAVQAALKRLQRVMAIAEGVDAQRALLDSGYDSVLAIARTPEKEFVAKSGLDPGQAKLTYARAQTAALSVAHGYSAFRDIAHGQFRDLAVGNVSPQLVYDLHQIDGFSDLFGPQDFCYCDSCHSVLSPAAYFCDLMHFVEQNVSKPVFITPKKTKHPLYLKTRRPDLWTLKLTCENTKTLVPYLTIVDEVLETFLTSVVGDDIYKTLADPDDKVSFRVPFSLPFAELDLYLSHFGLGPADVYRTLQLGDGKVWRAQLRLPPDEVSVIATADPSGVLTRLGKPGTLKDYPVQDFLRATSLTRTDLAGVLALRSYPDMQFIVVAKETLSDELQNFPEILQKLTPARVDFIHRFVRLWRATPWTIDELDLVLLALREGKWIGSDVDEGVIEQLGQLVELQGKLHLKGEELCALVGSLPVSAAFPRQPGQDSDLRLYERVFDLPRLFGLKDKTTGELNPTVAFHHYSLDTLHPTEATIDPKTPLLLGALGISETELLLLFDLLKDDLPFDASGNCILDRAKLSLLYRHVRVGRALKFAVDDLIRALQLLSAPGSQVLTSLEQVRELIEFRNWLRSSPFTTSELRLVLGGLESPSVKYANTADSVAQLVIQVQALADTGRMEVLRGQLASLFNVTASRLTDTLAWIAADIVDPAIATALDAQFADGVPDTPAILQPLVELIQQLERVNMLFRNLKLGNDSIAYLTKNPNVLGITSLKKLTLHDVQSLTFYQSLVTLREEVEAEVQEALTAYLEAGTVSPGGDRARLADLWQVAASLVDSLVDVLPLPKAPIDALARLSEGLDLCVTLGVNGYSLQKLGHDSDYAALKAARDVALGSFAAKYEDQAVRETKLEPYADRVNVLKRDALCDYIIARRPDLKFRDRSEIYNYFLLDVEMSGCFRTSRVVCATNSLQLYVQRCLLNLEQSDETLNPKIPDIKVYPSDVPANEWEWRKNYRVWEANRKVFLYPESYLEPDLRDDKTPIFRDLSDNLLQKKITKDTAAEAYERYMPQFAELTHLRICGSYYHSETSTYYFFGRTQQDPPVFYYRTWDMTTWRPWQKIDLAISAPYVAAEIHLGRLYVFWVEGRSKDKTSIKGGDSNLEYYEVTVNLAYSFMTPEGKWAAPQKLPWLYPSENETISAVNKVFKESDLAEMDLSKHYLKVYPKTVGDKIVLRYENEQLNEYYYFDRELDLFHNRLHAGKGIKDLDAVTAVMLDVDRTNGSARFGISEKFGFDTEPYFDRYLEEWGKFSIDISDPFPYKYYEPTDPRRNYLMHYVQNAHPESVFTFGDQQYLIYDQFSRDYLALTSAKVDLQMAFMSGKLKVVPRRLVRLSTSRADDLGEILMSDGLDHLFSLTTQKLREKPLGITITDLAQLVPPADDPNHLDFNGAFGGYYRELFLHIPWLIGFHLNANQQFEEAMWWYQRMFDPTANESADDVQKNDRDWRYIEFRNLTMPTLKAILTDSAAIDAYKHDAFNPFAIARLRPTAFQKAIVMHFVSNLLDWGDSLFARDTMESINEATMLYVLASEILGKRPVALGPCETALDGHLTYDKIGPAIDKGSEFLVTLENWHYVSTWQLQIEKEKLAVDANARSSKSIAKVQGLVGDAIDEPLSSIHQTASTTAVMDRRSVRPFASVVKERSRRTDQDKAWTVAPPVKRYPGPDLVSQCTLDLVFCVPQNEELLKYWDRVEDRLYKIHNCMNISGVRRSLALFAPPINPMALVRAKAAGLSLEEALAEMAAPVPPYRFSYLIERARQATQMVQSFGASLLSALEKKDVEELTLLRSVHEQTISRMTKDMKTKQVEEAQFTLQSTIENEANVQKRINYYDDLITTGLTGWEVTEQVSKHAATVLKIAESAVHLSAAITYLIPQAGSPFAMKYGGQELGHSGVEFAQWTSSMAAILDAVAGSAGLEATFQRRSQEWGQQLATAQQELRQLEQQRQAGEKRVAIAERDLEVHETTMDQNQEIYELYKSKFTNLGLYNYLATTLTRLHREAYKTAHDLAALAERAYRFETDDLTTFVAPGNWQFDRAGLLAGERLAIQLQQLESAYLARNTRRYEMTQSFSLALVNASALLKLRETGGCEFSLPEVLYDLAYPGQYKRLIKSVRLTIPCVTGPYTNVSAKLTLTQSQVRTVKTTDPTDLVPLPLQTTQSIATSTAQSDGGLFELNFRDERYLPFEGAGAVSTWSLELPSHLRLFDYDTIADVIIHVSYTALDDSHFRKTVEDQMVDELTEYASTIGMHRLFSLRHDFPNAFQLLLSPPGATQSTEFVLGSRHFPYFLAGHDLTVGGVSLYLPPRGADPVDTTGLKLTVNDTNAGSWTVLPETMLRTADVPVSGAALKEWTVKVTAGQLDPAEVGDILVLVKYMIS